MKRVKRFLGEARERAAIYIRAAVLTSTGQRVPRLAALKWWRSENKAATRYDRELAAFLDLAEATEELAFIALGALKQASQPPSVLESHYVLLARVLNDLRVCVILSRFGYTMQAWAVASSCFEAGNSMGFIGASETRAKRWLEHTDLENPPWSAYDAAMNCIIYLEIESDAEQREALVKREYQLYQRCCIGKHVHPASLRRRYFTERDGRMVLRLTPVVTRGRIWEAKLGLAVATRAATSGLWVFQKTHLPEDNELQAKIAALMLKMSDLFEELRERD